MSLTIAATSPPDEQRHQAQTYIRTNLQRFVFRDKPYAFLPLPFAKHLATTETILAVCTNDVRLGKEYFPSHSRAFFANRMRKEAPHCFAAVMYAGESMYFLRQLTNFAADSQLPIDVGSAKIEPELRGALETFGALQPLFFAPVMKVGDFAQAVITPPFGRVEEMGEEEEEGRKVWRVEFCEGHVEEGREREYFMVGFRETKMAEEDELWKRGRLGFWWGEEYFLCYE